MTKSSFFSTASSVAAARESCIKMVCQCFIFKLHEGTEPPQARQKIYVRMSKQRESWFQAAECFAGVGSDGVKANKGWGR